jgi:SAM-dependent methyltransferase
VALRRPRALSGLQDDVLEDLAEAVTYRRWLCDLARPHLGDDPLEVGSGLGLYAAQWRTTGVGRLTVSEADAGRLDALRERFAGDDAVGVRELSAPVVEAASYSCVVAFNVLEHIADDVEALTAFRGLLRPGGAVVLVVPAFPSAMSGFDRAIGHHRRYTKRSLRAAVEDSGLTVEVLRYVNSVGLLGWYVAVKLLRGRPRAGFLLTVFDRGVVPWLRRVEQRWEPPFGQSLLLVARR